MIATRCGGCAGLLAVMAAMGCSRSDPPTDVRAEPESSAVVSPQTSSSAASVAPKPTLPPTLAPSPLKLDGLEGAHVTIHTIDGAVIAATERTLYRLTDDGSTEKLGSIPKGSRAIGDNQINRVFGQWPDEVGASYNSLNGRAPIPSYHPIIGKGGWYTFAPGGGLGMFAGVARSGETTTIAGYDMAEGYRIIKVRGPLIKPRFTLMTKVGCELPEVDLVGGVKPAVTPYEYASTRAGTIVSVGSHCKGPPAAEIWRKPKAIAREGDEPSGEPKPFEPSTIISLKPWWSGDSHGSDLLRGPDDTLYIVAHREAPILRYRAGEITPLPKLPLGHVRAFVSPQGELFASNGQSLYELRGEAWKLRAELSFPTDHSALVKLGERFLAIGAGGLVELKPGARTLLDPAAESVECTTPFIYLFDARHKTPKHYRFPQTAKKMSTFAQLDAIELVDFERGRRRVGIKAHDWQAAKAAWAHVLKTMPDEHPRLLCFAPDKPRVLKVEPAP
jgi:hypothetical protein